MLIEISDLRKGQVRAKINNRWRTGTITYSYFHNVFSGTKIQFIESTTNKIIDLDYTYSDNLSKMEQETINKYQIEKSE